MTTSVTENPTLKPGFLPYKLVVVHIFTPLGLFPASLGTQLLPPSVILFSLCTTMLSFKK